MIWHFINVYGAAQEENKVEFQTELAKTIHNCKEPVLIGGDFNIIRFSNEKNKGGLHKHTGLFYSIINMNELIDLHMTGGKFTWSYNQRDPTLERLDRYLVSKTWESIFPLAIVYKLPREASDHNPIILSTSIKTPMKNLNFRFELAWLKHPNFIPKVQEIWESPYTARTAFDKFQIKLKKFKKYFKGWGFNVEGARKKLSSQLRGELLTLEQIEEIDTLTLDQINRKVQINTQLLDMLVDDELYWLKRSHENWLHKGDINTDYFHRVANGRRRKNTILSLNDNNSVIEGDENLLEHATKYYKELFGPGVGNVFQMNPGLWKDVEKVTDEDNHTLTQPFSEEEVKQALFQMEQNKASGPDCITIEFYQKCWGIIKHDIMEMFIEFYEGNLNVNRLNYRVITLLPKSVDANKI
jgi:mannosylglycoprotein endo-beta-mannosidase